jgi:hypothetical protein
MLERFARYPTGVLAPRVVFLPGALGSVLTDQSLTVEQARRECEANLGTIGNRLLRGSALYPCDKRPETLWGTVGSLHWLFNPEAWGRRMRSGNGMDMAGNLRAESLLDVDIRVLGRPLTFRPYASFLRTLRDAGADVLIFPYDWRLSNRHNAHLLLQAILKRWFGGQWLQRGRNLSEAERITFIGHSMGGLMARFFVESSLKGWALTRRLITIGTPHLGAPTAFLHFSGRTFPFPENPFYGVAHDIIRTQMAQAGVASQATFGAEFLPGRVQTDVFQFMASAIELMPVYNFVQNRGRLEPFTDTYRTLVHLPTRQAAMQVLERFRNGLLRTEALEEALRRYNLDYHFLAADGFPTVLGYERRGERIIRGPLGDGTVPLRSARALSASTAHVHVQTLTQSQYSHQRLCERPDVQAYCLNVVIHQPRPARAASMPAPQLEDYLAMAKSIMAKIPSRRGVVLSIARLAAAYGPPLVDTTTEPSTHPSRRRLKNPPAHLSSRDVSEVVSPRSGRFRYVLIHSNEESGYPIGGILFLPAPGETHIYLATFNVGPLDTRYPARCKNRYHAEIQLTGFIERQPANWRERLRTLRIDNRSRYPRVSGYSPCNACCEDLANFLRALPSYPRIDATLSWLEPYKGTCNPTDSTGLGMLKASGWKLLYPVPSAVRELAPIPEERREASRAVAGMRRR